MTAFVSGGFHSVAQAESYKDFDPLAAPDAIACLKAVDPLDMRYRGFMQTHCLTTAGDICTNLDETGSNCFADLNASFREYYGRLSTLLPATFRYVGYESSLAQLAVTFDGPEQCADFAGDKKVRCEYIRLGAAVPLLFYRARQTGVPLP